MTEEVYRLDEIEEAWHKSGKNWASMKEQLTHPEHKFTEGQVVAYQGRDGDIDYRAYQTVTNYNWSGYKTLTTEEVGPGYVPIEDVRPLVEFLDHAKQYVEIKHHARQLIDALPDNLKALIDGY